MSSSQLKTVQELSENGHLQEIPDDFIVPEEDRCNLKKDGPNSVTMESALEVPLIDMDEAAETHQLAVGGDCHSGIVQQIRSACEEWGFFQVMNHGVPLSVIKEMQQVVHEFLELPLEEKNKVMSSSLQRQKEGYSTRKAMVEGGLSLWSDRLHYLIRPVSTRNYDWWPKNPSRFREVVEHYCEEQNKLAKKLLELISESLGLKPSYINESLGEECVQTFIANYYPSCPQPELAMGLVKHSDPVTLTVLLQDMNAGLQVLKDGQWITVKPIEGALIVNLGDHMEIATNGRYKSIEHRAFVSPQPRLSIAVFTNPTGESMVGPIPELLVAEELPKYKQCSFADFKTLFLESFVDNSRQRLSGKKHMHTFMAQPALEEVTAS